MYEQPHEQRAGIVRVRAATCTHCNHCNTLHHTAPHCNTLHHTAPHCNTLHHTCAATHVRAASCRIPWTHMTPKCVAAQTHKILRTCGDTNMYDFQLVGSLKIYVSFAKEPWKRDDILQKIPIILRSLHVHVAARTWMTSSPLYEVPTLSSFLKNIGLFCKRALWKRQYSAKRDQ